MGKSSKHLYFIAIVPPHAIYEEVQWLKTEVAEKFNSSAALKSPPHITLHMPFQWKEEKEVLLCKELSSIEYDPFSVSVNGFGAFPPRVIYLTVENSDPLFLLWKNIVRIMSGLNIHNADYKNRGFTPHMTIAFRDLRKQMFTEAWKLYSNKEFRESWIVDRFSLLKHNGQKWQVFQEFIFQN